MQVFLRAKEWFTLLISEIKFSLYSDTRSKEQTTEARGPVAVQLIASSCPFHWERRSKASWPALLL